MQIRLSTPAPQRPNNENAKQQHHQKRPIRPQLPRQPPTTTNAKTSQPAPHHPTRQQNQPNEQKIQNLPIQASHKIIDSSPQSQGTTDRMPTNNNLSIRPRTKPTQYIRTPIPMPLSQLPKPQTYGNSHTRTNTKNEQSPNSQGHHYNTAPSRPQHPGTSKHNQNGQLNSYNYPPQPSPIKYQNHQSRPQLDTRMPQKPQHYAQDKPNLNHQYLETPA